MVVAYLPYQELETSEGFPCTIDPVDPVDYARAHDRDSVYGVRFILSAHRASPSRHSCIITSSGTGPF